MTSTYVPLTKEQMSILHDIPSKGFLQQAILMKNDILMNKLGREDLKNLLPLEETFACNIFTNWHVSSLSAPKEHAVAIKLLVC